MTVETAEFIMTHNDNYSLTLKPDRNLLVNLLLERIKKQNQSLEVSSLVKSLQRLINLTTYDTLYGSKEKDEEIVEKAKLTINEIRTVGELIEQVESEINFDLRNSFNNKSQSGLGTSRNRRFRFKNVASRCKLSKLKPLIKTIEKTTRSSKNSRTDKNVNVNPHRTRMVNGPNRFRGGVLFKVKNIKYKESFWIIVSFPIIIYLSILADGRVSISSSSNVHKNPGLIYQERVCQSQYKELKNEFKNPKSELMNDAVELGESEARIDLEKSKKRKNKRRSPLNERTQTIDGLKAVKPELFQDENNLETTEEEESYQYQPIKIKAGSKTIILN